MHTQQYIRASFLAVVLGIMALQTSAVRAVPQDPTQVHGYLGTLLAERGSTTDDGHIVVTMEVAGDLRGTLTATLNPGTNGSLSGTWILLASYVQDTNIDGSISLDTPHLELNEDHAHHHEYMKFMRDGSVQGTVSGVSLSYDAQGRPNGVTGGSVTVTGGTGKYGGVQGSGLVSVVSGVGGVPATTYTLTF